MELIFRSGRRALVAAAFGLAAVLPFLAAQAQGEKFIVMASTTSTEQSGLFSHLLPAFTRATIPYPALPVFSLICLE